MEERLIDRNPLNSRFIEIGGKDTVGHEALPEENMIQIRLEAPTLALKEKLINLKHEKHPVFTRKQLHLRGFVTRVDTPGPLINKALRHFLGASSLTHSKRGPPKMAQKR